MYSHNGPKVLRSDQANAIAMLREAVGAGERRIVMQGPTGMGKTLIAADMVQRARTKQKRVLITVPAISLVDQTVEALAVQGIRDVGVIQAQHHMTDGRQPVQVASIQTLMHRGIPQSDLVLTDECFGGGTLVDTPHGRIPIEKLKSGDAVYNATGVGFVMTVVKQHKRTRKVRLSNGESFNATADHPFFTERGWAELEERSRLFSREALRALWNGIPTEVAPERYPHRRMYMGNAAFLLKVLLEEAREPGVEAGGARKNIRHPHQEWEAATGAGRQWEAATFTSDGATDRDGSWMGGGVGCANAEAARQRVPDVLQNRHSERGDLDRYRGRWGEPRWRQTSAGQEERRPLGDVRVENLSSEESGCFEPVYNLRISGHPSYFAGGVLAHNCHKWFKFYEQWFQNTAWQNVPIIGLSATPWTKGLGAYYGKLIVANTIAEMIQQGLLAPFRVFAPTHPDLSGVRTVAGDYHEGDLFEAMRPHKLVADIVESWKKLGADRPTVCFAVNRAHAAQIAAEFETAGVPSGYMDCETPLLERATTRSNLKSGRIKVVCNVDVIGLGVDWPEVSCIIYARPTRSQMRYVQNIGRGLRIAEGKTDLVIIDHSDTTLCLGYVSDIHHAELNDGKPKLTAEKVITLPKECPQCHYVKPPRMAVCPNCGYEAVFQAVAVKPEAGDLKELPTADLHKPAPVAARLPSKAETYAQLIWYSRDKKYSDGWASNKYREIYGVWPRSLDWERHFKAPEMVLASWIKSQQIRYAKGKGARAKWQGAVKAAKNDAPQQVPGTLMNEEDLKYI